MVLKWIFLAAVLGLIGLVVWQSPAEATLGDNIKYVYVHVGLVWAGALGFTVAGLLSMGLIITQEQRFLEWIETLSWIALGWFGAGFVVSMIAAQVIWGGIPLRDEARALASLLFIGLALVTFAMRDGRQSLRAKGGLGVGLVVVLYLSTRVPLVLHPDSPIRSSESAGIQSSFFGLFVLFSMMMGGVFWVVVGRKR